MPHYEPMSIPDAEKALKSGSPEKRLNAVRFLANLAGERALSLLVDEVLTVPADSELKKIAAAAMKQHGVRARKRLTELLRSDKPVEREGALMGLAGMGVRARRSAEAIIEHLWWDDIPAKEQTLTLRVLTAIGPDAEPFLYDIEPLIASERNTVRSAAVTAYGSVGREHPFVFDSLTEYIQCPEYWKRTGAMFALSLYGRRGFEIARWLLNSRIPGIRLSALELLELLSGGISSGEVEDAIPGFRNIERSVDEFAEEVGDVLPVLEGLLNDPDMLVRSQAARTIGLQGKRAERSIPALIHAVRTWSFGYWDLEFALTRIGSPIIPWMKELIFSEVDDIRMLAVRTLGNVDDPGSERLELLCLALVDEDEHVADCALSRLRQRHPARIRASLPVELPILGEFLPALMHPRRKTANRALRVLRTNDSDEWEYFLSGV